MTTEDNKTIARRFFDEVVSNGNLGVVDELCSPDYRVHATLSGPDAIDRDQMKELVTSFRSSFPDARITHAGVFKKIPPTGRRVRTGQ